MDTHKILKMLEGKSLSFADLAAGFEEPTTKVEEALNQLEESGAILFDGQAYQRLADLKVHLGTIVTRKANFAFVDVKGFEKDFRLTGEYLKGLIGGDRIYVHLDSARDNCRYAGFYKRPGYLVGTLTKKPRKGYYLRSPAIDEADVKTVFANDPESFGAADGDLVKAKITEFDEKHLDLEMTALLVRATDVGADISRIIASNDAPLFFEEEVLSEAKRIPQQLNDKDLDGRIDLRDHLIVTIDGEDALDFDDAVEITRIVNGYEIGVHIADVSHYVAEKSAIDGAAFERGTSIYVADRVVPMLPTELSNGICSLNPGVDRLTMSVVMKVDERGNVYQSQLLRGVICSKGRLTYREVNEFLAGDEESELEPQVKDMLSILNEAALKIRKRREKSGAMKLDSTELRFSLDAAGHPLEVEKREQGAGEKLIEDLMIIANVAVASEFAKRELPTLYRIHENPPEKKIEALKNFLIRSRLSKDFPSQITPHALDMWLSKIEDPGQHKVASMMLLRSLAKARYSPENLGHFGLAESDYLHFTSPIRRYPDLIVHRLVKRYLLDEKKLDLKRIQDYLEMAGDHLSVAERRAQSIEREVDDLEAMKYMAKRIGDQFVGLVTNLMPFGMFMELDNGIDVLLRYDLIDDDTYIYDPDNFRVAGINSKRWFNIGSEVAVKVYSVDPDRFDINVATVEYFDNREAIEGSKEERRAQDRNSYAKRSEERPSYRRESDLRTRGDRDEKRSYTGSSAYRGSRPQVGERSGSPRRSSSSGPEHQGEGRTYDRPKRSYTGGRTGGSGAYHGAHQQDGERSSYPRRPYSRRPEHQGEDKAYDRPRHSYTEGRNSETGSYRGSHQSGGERTNYSRRPYSKGTEKEGGTRSYSRPGHASGERGGYSKKPYSPRGEKSGDKNYNHQGGEKTSYGGKRSYPERSGRAYGKDYGHSNAARPASKGRFSSGRDNRSYHGEKTRRGR